MNTPRVTKVILESDRVVIEAEMPFKEDSPMLGRLMSGLPVNLSMGGRAIAKERKLSWLRRAWRWVMTKIFRRKPKKEPLMVMDFRPDRLEMDLSNSHWNFGEANEKRAEADKEATESA